MGSKLGTGRQVVTAAGTAEALTADATFTAPTGPLKTVAVTAETDNTGIIVVGDSLVVAALATRRGTPLAAGATVSIDTDDLSDVYVDSTVSGDGVSFTWLA